MPVDEGYKTLCRPGTGRCGWTNSDLWFKNALRIGRDKEKGREGYIEAAIWLYNMLDAKCSSSNASNLKAGLGACTCRVDNKCYSVQVFKMRMRAVNATCEFLDFRVHAFHRAHWHWLSLDPNRVLGYRPANATCTATAIDLARRPNSCSLELGAVHVECGSRHEMTLRSDFTIRRT
jgi:hypothetical protein